LPRERDRFGVAIDPDQPSRAAFEQHPRVPAEAQRAIDEHTAPLGLQQRADFVDQDWDVHLNAEVRQRLGVVIRKRIRQQP
jgi:hypothetical protein